MSCNHETPHEVNLIVPVHYENNAESKSLVLHSPHMVEYTHEIKIFQGFPQNPEKSLIVNILTRTPAIELNSSREESLCNAYLGYKIWIPWLFLFSHHCQ